MSVRTDPAPVLEVRGVKVAFGGVQALAGISFTVGSGELLGIIGPNGAGKTTALRVVTGVVSADAGSVHLNGHPILNLPVHRRVRLGVSFSQQLVRPFRSMTLLDNVAVATAHATMASPWRAALRSSKRREREQALHLLEKVGIADQADRMPTAVPLGYLKRLEMARALALEPSLLLLDEPLAGLNHVEATRLADTIVSLNREGLAIALIEHNLGEIMRIVDRLVIIDRGTVLAEGEPHAVMREDAVRAAYLGVGHAAA